MTGPRSASAPRLPRGSRTKTPKAIRRPGVSRRRGLRRHDIHTQDPVVFRCKRGDSSWHIHLDRSPTLGSVSSISPGSQSAKCRSFSIEPTYRRVRSKGREERTAARPWRRFRPRAGLLQERGAARRCSRRLAPVLLNRSCPTRSPRKTSRGRLPRRFRKTQRRSPNNPVGVVWIGINVPHYGIHGTPGEVIDEAGRVVIRLSPFSFIFGRPV